MHDIFYRGRKTKTEGHSGAAAGIKVSSSNNASISISKSAASSVFITSHRTCIKENEFIERKPKRVKAVEYSNSAMR